MIRLLHLSDLHFGAHSLLHGEDHTKAGKAFHQGLRQEYKNFEQHRPDLVVVTGDFTEIGRPQEFQDAERFLGALAGELGLDRHRFVFCPGNHDIWRPACRNV